MTSLLEQLANISVVVADTGDIDAIKTFAQQDATTNPSLILKAFQSGHYDALIESVVRLAQDQQGTLTDRIDRAGDYLIVAMGNMILQHIPGRISTEVNASLSFDRDASIEKARQLIALYEAEGVPRHRVLIKLAATWEGIKAAEVLEQEGIQCNLTLIFNFAQARACAEAGVYLISPFVGRILDWHRKNAPDVAYANADEPGVKSVAAIQQYFRARQYQTVVMGASFRHTGQILALAGCDRLTISPGLLEELQQTPGTISRQLPAAAAAQPRPEPMTEQAFRWALNEDAMATEKLAEGIRGFAADQRKLDALLAERLQPK